MQRRVRGTKMSAADPASVTVADLLAHGANEVKATCPRCATSWQAPVSFLPPTTNLDEVRDLLICPQCASQDIGVEPWPPAAQLH
jgi:hypothetical protein